MSAAGPPQGADVRGSKPALRRVGRTEESLSLAATPKALSEGSDPHAVGKRGSNP